MRLSAAADRRREAARSAASFPSPVAPQRRDDAVSNVHGLGHPAR